MDTQEWCWLTSQVYIAAGSLSQWCLFTLIRSTLRPPYWFTAVQFGMLAYISWSANSVVTCIAFWCLSLRMSHSLCLSAESTRGARGGGKQVLTAEVHTSVHPSTHQASHYHCKLGEGSPLSDTIFPEKNQLGFVGDLWTRSNSSAETMAGSQPRNKKFNELVYCAQGWLPLTWKPERVT